MYFFKIENGVCTKVDEKHFEGCQTRHDLASFQLAEFVAKAASDFTGKQFLAVDHGQNVWPQFDIACLPEVSDEVSYSFNGDSYPDGRIVSISSGPKKTIKTSTGNLYYRRRQTASWIKKGGTWSLIKGHHSEWNPEF